MAKMMCGREVLMQSTQTKIRMHKRVQKEGCFFGGLRVVGWLLIALGSLILLGGMIGFISVLLNSGSDLISSLQYWEQQMAKLVFTLILTALGTFAALGCLGLVMIGTGFGLDRAATQPVAFTANPIDKPLSPA
jgi:hypothetical protein